MAFQISIGRMLNRTELPPEFSLCHLISVVWDKESSQLTSDRICGKDKPRFQITMLHFRRCLEAVIFHPLRNMYINTYIWNQIKVISVFLLMSWTLSNFIARTVMHIFMFKNGLLCAYFPSFQENVYHRLLFSFCWN